MPNKTISLGADTGEIPLLTTRDSTFPCLEWSIKGCNEQTSHPDERLFNKKSLKRKGCYRKRLRNF